MNWLPRSTDITAKPSINNNIKNKQTNHKNQSGSDDSSNNLLLKFKLQ